MTKKLTITSRDRALDVVIEPLGEVFSMPANSAMDVTLEGDGEFDEHLEINFGNDHLVFWVFGKNLDIPKKQVEVRESETFLNKEKEPPNV